MAASSSTSLRPLQEISITPDRLEKDLTQYAQASHLHVSGKLTHTHLQQLGEHLSGHTELTCLRLASVDTETPSPKFIEAIRNSSTLYTLRFYTSKLKDSDARLCSALTSSTSLTNLGINTSTVSPSCIEALGQSLATNSTLTHLSLAEASVDDTGGRALATALLTNHTISSINLEGNDSTTSRTAIDFAIALRTNSTLEKLNLDNERPQTNRAYPSIRAKLERNTWNIYHRDQTLFGILFRELEIQPLMEEAERLMPLYLKQKEQLEKPLDAKSQKQRKLALKNQKKLNESFEKTREDLFYVLHSLKQILPRFDRRRYEVAHMQNEVNIRPVVSKQVTFRHR